MFKKHWILIVNLIILLSLLAKNPFSTRTLIPNLEPYPDTIHYLSPAWNAVAGHGFQLFREGRGLHSWVPPIYSVLMIPAFLLKNDVRMFYFVNIFLSIVSLVFLYLILRKVTNNRLLLGVTLFFYVTNYFIYWYPSLAMGENLVLTLFLAGIWLVTIPITSLTLIVAPLVALLVYLTKSANIPISLSLGVIFFVKIIVESKQQNRAKNISLFLFTCVALLALMTIFAKQLSGGDILSSLVFFLANIFPKQEIAKTIAAQASTGWFSIEYMKKFLPDYILTLFGGHSIRFLWENTPILPIIVGTPGVVGLIIGSINKKLRALSLVLILAALGSIVFMSTFYSQDMRYLYHLIPTLLIGFVIFWEELVHYLTILLKKVSSNLTSRASLLVSLFLILLFIFYSVTNTVRLKKQVMLNLKYAETPWYYLSIIKLNEYFKEYPKNVTTPIVISSMVPYYIDFFSNGNFKLLPLSTSQEFRDHKEDAWGIYDYSDLIALYTKLLKQGQSLYVHNYGIGNEKPLQNDFKKIQDTFTLTKVADGCFNACTIWKVEELKK